MCAFCRRPVPPIPDTALLLQRLWALRVIETLRPSRRPVLFLSGCAGRAPAARCAIERTGSLDEAMPCIVP